MSDNKKNTFRSALIKLLIFPFYFIFIIFFEVILGFSFGDKWDKLVKYVEKRFNKKCR